MHAQIDELFEFAGIVLARVRVVGPGSDVQTGCCRLEQNGIVLSADHRCWFEIPSAPPRAEPKGGPNRRRAITVRQAQRPETVYLVGFAGEACSQLSHDGPVTVTVQAGRAEIGQQSLTVGALTVARFAEPGFKAALGAAVQASGVPAVAAVLNASIQVEALGQFDHVEIRHAIFANAGLVLNGWIRDFARRDIHIVSADLRSWVPPSLIASHTRHDDGPPPATEAEGESQSPRGLDFTAVLRAAGQATQDIYVVEVEPSGTEAVFYGPVTIRGISSEQQALQRVKDAFGPIQSLPTSLVPHVYWPVLARPKTSVRARRFTFGPPIDEAAPLASIIIPYYGDAFFLNCVSHLQRVLGSGFELILVVDDPRIWPTVYGHLSARRSSITVPTVLLECEENYGYARANNLGFMAARGDVVFLMNSDIMVLDATALRQAAGVIRARRHAREPEAIIGFSLRFEDDTLQHIGMEFPRSPLVGDMRLADHPLKGMPSDLYDGEAVRRAPAVTGALMALSSDLYQTLGGFDAAYERGDFEDADLCLRAQQIGAEVWVHVAPGLYHLERQSIRTMGDNHLRETITYLNCLTFNARWDAHLSEGALGRLDTPARSTAGRRPISVRKRHTLPVAPHQPAPARAG